MASKTKNRVTLEQLLIDALRKNVTVRLVPVVGRDGGTEFYAHPDGADGETLDFGVKNDTLTALHRAAGG